MHCTVLCSSVADRFVIHNPTVAVAGIGLVAVIVSVATHVSDDWLLGMTSKKREVCFVCNKVRQAVPAVA